MTPLKTVSIIFVVTIFSYYLWVFLRITRPSSLESNQPLSFSLIGQCAQSILKNVNNDRNLLLPFYIILLVVMSGLAHIGICLDIIDTIFIGVIFALMRFDYRYYLLPDPLVYLLMWLGILGANFGLGMISIYASVNAVVVSYLLFMLVALLGHLIFGRESLGQGDVKFYAAINAWIGLEYLFEFIFVSASVGLCYGIWARFYRKGSSHLIPFGVALGGSGIIFFLIQKFQLLSA